MMLASTTLFLSLTLPSVPPASVERAPIAVLQDGYAAAKTEAQAELVSGLVDVAKWCKKNRIFLEGHKVYEVVLRYDPDQKDARKELGYKWSKKEEEW